MEEKKKGEIQIEIDENTAHGVYSNLAMIGHSEGEFILDFIFMQPQNRKAKVRSRVILSPNHTKRLLTALKDNITKYEARFGALKSNIDDENKKVGFYN
ncbi:DUF3467 domain-containing protein [Elusimicrobiota bacterium]